MTDLTEFLNARFDEDEAVARVAVSEHEQELRLVACDVGDRWIRRYGDYGATEVVDLHGHVIVSVAHDKGAALRTHIARHDPARVLREVEAKRRIVDAHERRPMPKGDTADCAQCWGAVWPCPTLRLLALPYAQHLDYRPERAPNA